MEIQNIEHLKTSSNLKETKEKISRLLLITGIISIVLGIAAILLPFLATLTIELILSFVLIIAGINNIINAFESRHSKGLLLRLLTGIAYGLFGITMILYPHEGAITLTVLLAMLFLFIGSIKIALALSIRPLSNWRWLMLNGILSLLLGTIIWLGLPGARRWAIGTIVGMELLFNGCSMIMFTIPLRVSKEIEFLDEYKNS